MTVFVLDTNVISDIVRPTPNVAVVNQIEAHRGETLCLYEPVDYEVRRGYLKAGATARLLVYEERIRPQFQWVALVEADWRQAAQFWADAVQKGKQLSDVDLLIAAVALRLNAQIISADDDFDALPLTRHSWRG
jgi:predicted nucleic acid-binding protein